MKLTPEYIASQVLTCEFDYNGTLTTCTITTRHGSKHVGTSGCLDPANYDRAIGEQIAHKNALDQLWALEGYFFSKLGLSQVQGEVDVRLGVSATRSGDSDRAEKWGQHFVTVGVYMTHSYPGQKAAADARSAAALLEEIYATGGIVKGPTEVDAANLLTPHVSLVSKAMAAKLERIPTVGHDAMKIVMANAQSWGPNERR